MRFASCSYFAIEFMFVIKKKKEKRRNEDRSACWFYICRTVPGYHPDLAISFGTIIHFSSRWLHFDQRLRRQQHSGGRLPSPYQRLAQSADRDWQQRPPVDDRQQKPTWIGVVLPSATALHGIHYRVPVPDFQHKFLLVLLLPGGRYGAGYPE